MFKVINRVINVPYSCKIANKLATSAYKEAISTAISFFSVSGNCRIQLITYNTTYHWSFIGCNLSEHLTFKISWRKVKMSNSPRGGIFSLQPEVKGTFISKKTDPGVNFTSPTCNMPLKIIWIIFTWAWSKMGVTN